MEENITQQSCQFCKNRHWTSEQDMVCGLTGMKMESHEECNDFKLNEEEPVEYTEESPNNEDSVSGWLFFFLWFVLIGGALLSVIKSYVALLRGGCPVVFAVLITLFSEMPLVYIGIRAVRGFYKKANYAFSAAMTYMILPICDAISDVIVMFLTENAYGLPQMFRSVVWALIWMTYLLISKQVKKRVPVGSRVWTWKESVTIIFYVIICSGRILLIYLN